MKTILIFCIFALCSSVIKPCQAQQTKSGALTITDSLQTDPVCNMKVKLPAKYKSIFEKKEFVFCNKRCKSSFDNNPGEYPKKISQTPLKIK